MKTILTLSAVTILATVLVTGCNKNGSTNDYSTNSVTGGTGGMIVETNLAATNTVPTNMVNTNQP